MLKGEEINSLPTYNRIKKGMAYMRLQQSVFTSLSVKEQRRLARTDRQFFGNTLHCKSKGGNLSGGEKQKIAIEMLPSADLYLLDEPIVGLDKWAIDTLLELINQWVKRDNIILITVPENTNED